MSDEVIEAVVKQRRPRASRQEKAQWAQRFYQSGLPQHQFAQQHGIANSTLQRWVAQHPPTGQADRSPCSAGAVPAFAELKLSAETAASSWAAEVCWPSGLVLRVREELPGALLERLLALC